MPILLLVFTLYTGSASLVQPFIPKGCESSKVLEARVTGYCPEPGARGALGKVVKAGRTAAVSRNCYYLLGEQIYVDQHGMWEVEDLTAGWVGEKFDMCTIDLAKPTKSEAAAVGNDTCTVVRIPE